MGRLEDEVRELIKDRYRSLAEFSRTIGIPKQTLYSALDNSLAGASLSTAMPICAELGLDPAEVVAGRLTPASDKPQPVFVPVYGSIAAGNPMEMQQVEDEFPIPASLHETFPNAFMLRVVGNSMNRVLPDGFLALVDPCRTVDQSRGIYALAVGEQDATVKRVIVHDNGITLQPDSYDPTYRPQLLDYSDPSSPTVAVIGRVVWWCPPAASR